MNSYSVIDIAISLCRYTEIYELANLKNICDRVEIEIQEVLKPLRGKVLRGYYLMSALNSSIDSKSDNMISDSTTNKLATDHIQRLQENFVDIAMEIKENIENSYKTYIDIIKETDPQIAERFRNDQKAHDFIFVRNILNNIKQSLSVPIELTQKNMTEIGYNNKRIDGNLVSAKSNALKLGKALDLSKRHSMIKDVITEAIDIKNKFIEAGEVDYIKSHTNQEVKEWLNDRIS